MNKNSYYNAQHQHGQTQQKPANYLDLIKGGVSVRSPNKLNFNEHGNSKKYLSENENYSKESRVKDAGKQSILSTISMSNQKEQSERNRLSNDSSSLNDLDIKHLTNTRQKVQNRKNIMELKNQMSPVYFNRDAERFSYLDYQDPLTGNQIYQYNKNNFLQQHQYNQYPQQMINQEQYAYANKYNNPQQSPNPAHLYNNNNYNNFNGYTRKDISTINEYIKQNQHFQSENSSLSSILPDNKCSFLSNQSEYVTERREDSFGNVEIVRRKVEQPQNKGANILQTPNLPQPPSISDPDLLKYTRNNINQPISTAYQDNSRSQARLIPKINFATIIFLILVIYIAYKNINKFLNGESVFNQIAASFKNFSIQQNKKPQQTKNKLNKENLYQQNSEDSNNNSNMDLLKNNNYVKEEIKQDMDSHLAKKFAKELVLELVDLLKVKGKLYRSEYEENLSKRFMNTMLREILPEINKLLLNSKHIRIQYDVIQRQDYFELIPQNFNNQ
ncbi:hypothetical protein ABPG74_009485 [Tetrahymena malaccensis]